MKNEAAGLTGGSLVTYAAMAETTTSPNIPWYDSWLWLSFMAVIGGSLIAVSLYNAINKARKK